MLLLHSMYLQKVGGPTPPEVRANQLAATVDNYRQQAIANGLPFR